MGPVSQTIFEELILATRILANKGILDGFGHVSARSTSRPDHYYMVRDNATEVTDGTGIMELDIESNPVSPDSRRPSIERFIHGEIYRARPDVRAIVHTHSPHLIPFGISKTPLKPLYHMCGFLDCGAPIFDIALEHGDTDLLVTSREKGQSLARSLGGSALVLMRGHGATTVGFSVKEAVYRAVYATLNAQLQPVAMQLGEPKYLSSTEASAADELHKKTLDRAWNYWVKSLDEESRPPGTKNSGFRFNL